MRIFCLMLFVLLFASCAKLPKDKEIITNSTIPESFRNLDSNIETKNEKKESKKPESNIDLIEQFSAFVDDKNLIPFLQIALENNPDSLILASRINQAIATAKINTASLFPTINGSINTSAIDNRTLSQNQFVRPGSNSVNASLNLSWEVDLFGKLAALRSASKKDIVSAKMNLEFAQISLISQVSTLYYTICENLNSIKINKEKLAFLEEIYSINEAKFNLGLLDLATFKTTKQNLVTQKNALESSILTYETNLSAFVVLLNIKEKEVLNLFNKDSSLPLRNDLKISAIPSEVILNRADVKASINTLYARIYRTRNASLARLPSITLNGSIGQILYSSLNSNNIVFQIANSIAAPLLNRTQLRQNYKIQKELQKEAKYNLEKTITTALGEIEVAAFNKDSTIKKTDNYLDLLKTSNASIKNDELKLKRGVISNLDFLNAKNEHLNIEKEAYNAKIGELIAMIQLYKSLGGGI